MNAQVRSTSGNTVRSGSEKEIRTNQPVRSDANQVRQSTRSNSPVRSNSDQQIRSNNSSTNNVRSNIPNPVRNTNAPTVRSEPVRTSQINNGQAVRGNTSSDENSKIIRVENQPKARNFDRNSVRFENGSTRRVIYHNNNNANFNHVTYNHNQYYLDNGYYYQLYNNRYRRVMAPVGFYIHTLPIGYTNIYIGGNQYYYYNGTYYNRYNSNYYVVQPPVGAIVYALPADYEKVYINGQKYYEYFGVLYQKVYYYGDRAYQVVGYLN